MLHISAKPLHDEGMNSIEIPKGAKVHSVTLSGNRDRPQLVIESDSDSDSPNETREFYVTRQGPIPFPALGITAHNYVGTTMGDLGTPSWHVFEILERRKVSR